MSTWHIDKCNCAVLMIQQYTWLLTDFFLITHDHWDEIKREFVICAVAMLKMKSIVCWVGCAPHLIMLGKPYWKRLTLWIKDFICYLLKINSFDFWAQKTKILFWPCTICSLYSILRGSHCLTPSFNQYMYVFLPKYKIEIGPDKTKVMTNNPNGFQRGTKIKVENFKYRKFPKYSDTQKICCNHSKIWTMWLYHRVMSPNGADRMANSADPDQTAPLGAVWSGSPLFA